MELLKEISVEHIQRAWDEDWPEYDNVGDWWPILSKDASFREGIALICPNVTASFGVRHRHWINAWDGKIEVFMPGSCENVSAQFVGDTLKFKIWEKAHVEQQDS